MAKSAECDWLLDPSQQITVECNVVFMLHSKRGYLTPTVNEQDKCQALRYHTA
jgi:hypothetical protein